MTAARGLGAKRYVLFAGAVITCAAVAAASRGVGRWVSRVYALKRLDVFPILTYHRVVPGPSGEPVWGDLLRDDFVWQMRWLKRRGYRGVSLGEAWRSRSPMSGRPPRELLVITFDDAYTETGDVAGPVLEKLGFAATVFVPTAFAGGKGYFTRSSSQRAHWPRIMDWDELDRLRSSGFEIGSHTRTHPFLDEAVERDDGWARDEILGSRDDIEARLGSPPAFIAYPHGSFDQRVQGLVSAAGYEAAVTTLLPDGTAPPDALRRRDWFADDPDSLFARAKLRARFALTYPGPYGFGRSSLHPLRRGA